MKRKPSKLRCTAFSLLLLTSAVAFAHGNEHENKNGPVKKEQKEWGIAGDAKAAKRIIEVTMLGSMRFIPDTIKVKQGETVKFIIKNAAPSLHEFVIGTQKENQEHAALMLKFPDMEHAEPYMAHVGAGKTGEIIWTFNKAGNFEFACLMAGHYQAGMVGKILVAKTN